MRGSGQVLGIILVAVPLFGVHACGTSPGAAGNSNPIVGTWFVRDPDAPFPYHMYVFNADGTMQQANPDAGDPHSSDSDGKGVWVRDGDFVKGKWVEVTADRATHKYTGRAEISFRVRVSADTFTGTISAGSYDVSGNLIDGPTKPTLLEGKRVTLP